MFPRGKTSPHRPPSTCVGAVIAYCHFMIVLASYESTSRKEADVIE